MSGRILFGVSTNNTLSITDDSGKIVQLTDPALEDPSSPTGSTNLTSFERAQMAGYSGTEGAFYTELSRIIGSPVHAGPGIDVATDNEVLMNISTLPTAP